MDNAHQVGGLYRSFGGFTFMVVPKGGHMVPITNYIGATAVVDDWIANDGVLSCKWTNDNCNVQSTVI